MTDDLKPCPFCGGDLTYADIRAALDKAEETIRESALQYLSDTGQLMEQIAHLKEREEYLVDLLDRITDHQAVIDCLTLQELDEVSGAMAASWEK